MSVPQAQIRLATLADVPALVPLVESAYRGEVSKAGWTTEADYLDGQRTDPQDLATIIATPGQSIHVLEQGGRLLASVHLKHQGGHCFLGMFAVSPTLQGAGIGRRLVTHAEQFARTVLQATAMRMYVISIRTTLIAWYERLGYTRTGETAPFPYGNPRFGLPKRDDLAFIVLGKALQAPTGDPTLT